MTAYLDNSATTMPSAAVRQLASELLSGGWYNPSALYKPAMEIQKQMDAVRDLCLKQVHAPGGQVVFTSGGTEADNLALLGFLSGQKAPGRVLMTSVEHPAISACREPMERMGFSVEEIPVTGEGLVSLPELKELLDERVKLICIMQVNNETGAVQPLKEIAEYRNQLCPGAALHVDGVQGFLRCPTDMKGTGIQSYAFSAHKIQGLKGCGALVLNAGHSVKPVQFGGGQENRLRSGTENTLGILTLGEAIRTYREEANGRMRELKLRLWKGIRERIPTAELNGPDPAEAVSAPHILNVALTPVRSQTMLFALEGDGIYVSAGSACASRKQKISPVLRAMGIRPERADCSLRFSLSPDTTEEQIDRAAERTAAHYDMLKRFVRR